MQKARMVNMRAFFCGVNEGAFAGKPRSYRLCAIPVGARLAREGVSQSNPSLSGNSYSATSALGLPRLLSVGSFSRHSTR
ncbi:hypothetical protein C9I49_12120 [Pseudomonas prosekii]|uniref:Uncharacterized protein n=1 Tax=Pseudomonas prosekii TaxID=1148509 RepID=A0A2U2D8R3_9PSED|nr:hypothetical protein C9I49_12120 [Pseudomonas prosekii]